MRTLIDREVPLMRRLLAIGRRQELAEQLLIEPMADGGMGGLRIGDCGAGRKLGHTVAEVQLTDADGVFVTAVLNVDTQDRLLEVDIWKVDFSPLQHWPIEREMELVLSNTLLQRTATPPAER